VVDGERDADAAARAIAEATGVLRHDAAIVLGSGWGEAADAFGAATAEIAYADLPGFLPPVAPGHAGVVRSYKRGGKHVLAFLGRTHLFEGHGPGPVAHAVRTAAAAGCHTVVLTNASGSLRDGWAPGTGVVLTDHLNMTGVSPLAGAKFVDLTDAWSPRLRALAHELDPTLEDGVYAMLPGPHYNTRAEAIMLRTLGADLVGMSTVLEAIAARAAGLELLGISTVTTQEIDGPPIDPDQVVAVAAAAAIRLGTTLATILDRLDREPAAR
jgi:purine-nucleoside phosphorylase